MPHHPHHPANCGNSSRSRQRQQHTQPPPPPPPDNGMYLPSTPPPLYLKFPPRKWLPQPDLPSVKPVAASLPKGINRIKARSKFLFHFVSQNVCLISDIIF